MGAKRVLIISDKGVKDAGIIENIENIFKANGGGIKPAVAGVFAEVTPDAEISCINDAVDYARRTGADSLLAVGGGSVLDAVKTVKYCLQHNIQNLSDELTTGLKLDLWPQGQPSNIPHIAIPTTAGTGAEVTPAAVVYNAGTKVKSLLMAPYLEADIAVLDPKLLERLPRAITIATAFDALTHALEALASPAANHFTDAHAFRAAQIIEQSLPVVVENPSDLAARSNLLQASTMACDAISNALNACLVHNCSHALGGLYHIPHGEANGVLLPIVLDEMRSFYLPNGRRLASAMNISNCLEMSDDEALEATINRITSLQNQIGFNPLFADYEISQRDEATIISSISNDILAMFYPISPDRIRSIVSRSAGW